MLSRTEFDQYLKNRGVIILDGGLATELEKMGHDLNHHLWSARLLISDPDEIKKVHHSYLSAGADCIISASYQTSLDGFVKQGLTNEAAQMMIRLAIELAIQSRNEFARKSKDPLPPLVAASIGPYGAYLADGSEFRGDYSITFDELYAFHEPRWKILGETDADIFACETIPSYREAEVLLSLLKSTPNINTWISFSCKDEMSIRDGTPLRNCAALFNKCDQIFAIGINCTAPKYVSALIDQVRLGAPAKHVVVYPNSGEIYDTTIKSWKGLANPINYGTAVQQWYTQGARLIGGCCRTGPEHIRAIRQALS
jgi:homocysteine S-methyltransferase